MAGRHALPPRFQGRLPRPPGFRVPESRAARLAVRNAAPGLKLRERTRPVTRRWGAEKSSSRRVSKVEPGHSLAEAQVPTSKLGGAALWSPPGSTGGWAAAPRHCSEKARHARPSVLPAPPGDKDLLPYTQIRSLGLLGRVAPLSSGRRERVFALNFEMRREDEGRCCMGR